MIWINFNSVHRIEIRKEHLRSLLHLAPLPYDVTLMADAAEAITDGFNLAGFPGVRGMCWFHVVKNLKKYFPRNKETAAMLRFDIEKLQISPRPFFEPAYISELLQDSSDESDDDNEADFSLSLIFLSSLQK